MKKNILILMLVALPSLFVGKAFSQKLYFDVTNKSGFKLYGLFISPYDASNPSASADWSDDLLPNDTFDPDLTVTITIPADFHPENCEFKFKVSYQVNGKTYEEVLCYVDACEHGAVDILKNTTVPGKYMKCQLK